MVTIDDDELMVVRNMTPEGIYNRIMAEVTSTDKDIKALASYRADRCTPCPWLSSLQLQCTQIPGMEVSKPDYPFIRINMCNPKFKCPIKRW